MGKRQKRVGITFLVVACILVLFVSCSLFVEYNQVAHLANLNIPSPLISSSSSSSSIPIQFQGDIEYCSKHNVVLARRDVTLIDNVEIRPYSISDQTFSSFHDRAYHGMDELLLAIQDGKRHWDPGHRRIETNPSYFIPAKYDIPILSGKDACDILSGYSVVYNVGDSLSRHMGQALLMLLKQDLILGGIESTHKHSHNNPYNSCQCDGQFSEHKDCRQNNGFFDQMTPRDIQVCSQLNDDKQFYIKYAEQPQIGHFSDWKLGQCSDPNARPIIVILEGGLHYHSSAISTIKEFVEAVMLDQGFLQCWQANKVKLIWIAFGAQSRLLDKKYASQSRDNATIFNDKMQAYWETKNYTVTILNWWNMTADSQTSDGVHFLSDVNLHKANHLLHVIQNL